MSFLKFEHHLNDGKARAGTLTIRDQQIETPAFMPVGTHATVKAITIEELKEIGYNLILSNTYHLHLRPGDQTIRDLGGLHQFMNWDQGILTDSGGFQVFSLAKLNQITEEGVHFQNHLDGNKTLLTPEKAIEIQENLNSDIMMVLDECIEIPVDKKKAAKSIQLTTRWANRSFQARTGKGAMFAIVQGADFEDLRIESAQSLMETGFDGFAIGGLSVGESKEVMYRISNLIAPILPANKPRYLMGVGEPEDIIHAIEAGIDMFDCVIPTRNARNGCLYTSLGKLAIKQSQYKNDPRPIDETCKCSVCQNYSRAYLNHLYRANEILSSRLNTYHNLWFFRDLVRQARQSIYEQRFQQFKKDFLTSFSSNK